MYQDWNTVILNKSEKTPKTRAGKNEAITSAQRSGTLITEKRFSAGNKSSQIPSSALRKLEEETDVVKLERVDKSLSQAIQQARLGKKLSQKELASMIHEKAQVIAEYESGKAIPNSQIILKIERALGTRLPRPKKTSKKPSI